MAASTVVNVTDGTFRDAVIEESRRRPVVVDFWADWCQPCRIIGPVLERLAEEHRGDFLLAKLDVDANPQTSTAFGVQSIPAVKAFRNGSVVNEFIGGVPEPTIKQFVQAVLPSEADRLVEQGLEAEREGRSAEAERLFRRALDADSRNEQALLGRGRLAALRGDVEGARALLEPLKPNDEAERILAAIEVSEWSSPEPEGNGQGPMARGQHAAAEGRWQEALDEFLREVRASGETTQAAREAMLKVFSVLGDDDPLTVEYRRKLAAALF
jgi:putative thioredoxin